MADPAVPQHPVEQMMARRQAADKEAMINAILGKSPGMNTGAADFATRYAQSVTPMEHDANRHMIGPNGGMLGPLIDLGYTQRPQGMYPPARYPSHYGPDKPL
jgi:hypothetical protein